MDLVAWRDRYAPEKWNRHLELDLADSLMLERIGDATQEGWPLGDEAFLKSPRNGVRRPSTSPSSWASEGREKGRRLTVTSTVVDDEELVE